MFYLYKITNEINNKVYIGQSIKEKDRWRQHKYFAKNPEITKQYIHQAMNKYGIDNFNYQIIAMAKTPKDADEIEKCLIEQFNSKNKEFGYNVAAGGEGAWNFGLPKEMQPMFGKKHSKESKLKIANGNLGKKNPHTESWSQKMSEIMTGRVLTKEWKEKLSISNKGKNSKLSPNDVIEIRKNKPTTTVKKLANKYNVSESTISNVLKRRGYYS